MDVRHQRRTTIVQQLYASSFSAQNMNDVDSTTTNVIQHQEKINGFITKFASKFPINKISRIDLAILQLSVYELAIEGKEPPKVVINEAVELAKELGSEKSYAFINAVLGKIYSELNKAKN